MRRRVRIWLLVSTAFIVGTSHVVATNTTYKRIPALAEFAASLGTTEQKLSQTRKWSDELMLARVEHRAPSKGAVKSLLAQATKPGPLVGEAWNGLMVLDRPDIRCAAVRGATSQDEQVAFHALCFLEVYKDPRWKALALTHESSESELLQLCVESARTSP